MRILKMMIRQNIIQNFPVTVEAVEIVGKIFGTGISTLKVITMRKIKKVVVDNCIEISRELVDNNQYLIMYMYILLIN